MHRDRNYLRAPPHQNQNFARACLIDRFARFYSFTQNCACSPKILGKKPFLANFFLVLRHLHAQAQLDSGWSTLLAAAMQNGNTAAHCISINRAMLVPAQPHQHLLRPLRRPLRHLLHGGRRAHGNSVPVPPAVPAASISAGVSIKSKTQASILA